MNTPLRFQQVRYRVQRSEFHGLLFPLEQVTELGEQLKKVRRDYHQARHIAWAYRVFYEGRVREHASDGGEPPGTAGMTILNVLRGNEVVNGVLYVARIFGGIKLGRPGLRRAYGHAARLALKAAVLKPWVARQHWVVTAPLEYYGELVQVLEQVDGRLRRNESGKEIYWQVEVPMDKLEQFRRLALARSRGQAQIKGWAGTTKPRR